MSTWYWPIATSNAARVFSGASSAPPRCAMFRVGASPRKKEWGSCGAEKRKRLLLTGEARRSLLIVGADSLGGVLTGEQTLLQLALQRQSLAKGHLHSRVNRPLDVARRHR